MIPYVQWYLNIEKKPQTNKKTIDDRRCNTIFFNKTPASTPVKLIVTPLNDLDFTIITIITIIVKQMFAWTAGFDILSNIVEQNLSSIQDSINLRKSPRK